MLVENLNSSPTVTINGGQSLATILAPHEIENISNIRDVLATKAGRNSIGDFQASTPVLEPTNGISLVPLPSKREIEGRLTNAQCREIIKNKVTDCVAQLDDGPFSNEYWKTIKSMSHDFIDASKISKAEKIASKAVITLTGVPEKLINKYVGKVCDREFTDEYLNAERAGVGDQIFLQSQVDLFFHSFISDKTRHFFNGASSKYEGQQEQYHAYKDIIMGHLQKDSKLAEDLTQNLRETGLMQQLRISEELGTNQQISMIFEKLGSKRHTYLETEKFDLLQDAVFKTAGINSTVTQQDIEQLVGKTSASRER